MKQATTKKSKQRAAKKTADDFHAIYLYYFPYGEDLRIYEWWDPDTAITDPQTEITKLIENAFKKGKYPPYHTKYPDEMIMRRKSYVAFAVDDREWNVGNTSEIDIKGKDHFGSKIPGDHTFKFKDYFSTQVTANLQQVHLVIYYENRMLSSRYGNEKLAHGEGENFTFELPFKRGARVASSAKRRLAPDSGGTNMGPPVPPPAEERLYKAKRRPARA